ncbi:cytoplasmic dynein 2 intermediate chain 1-like isoform X1 [Mytilus trossulus]|uniref:cytoplasmic dynein 2 intermediate chain 1-like isoform X1 n=1 Tax=Mytilus trossulus TaxID=6551 RepID=UPI0030050D95
MPVEKKSKEDTWTPSELKKAMGKDTLRREREERKKERLRDDQNGEEKHRRRKDEDETKERRHHRDDDDRKRHKEKDRHHRNEDDEGRRRRRDRDSPDRIETTEEDRERQRRERREKREGKSKGDDDRKRKDDDDSKRRRHKEEDRERSNKDEDRRKHRDDDEKRRHRDDDGRRRDKDEEKRRHRGDDDREKRRHRDDDDREKRRHRDEDGDRRGHRGEDDREKRKHHRDEDERDRRKEKKDRDRHKESEEGSKKHRHHRDEENEEMETELDEDERERQRRERRDKKEGRDRKDGDREKDERDKRSKEEDVRTKSAVNGRSKPKEEDEEENEYGGYEDDFEDYDDDFEEEEDEEPPKKTNLSSITPRQPRHGLQYSDDEMNDVLRALDEENDRLYKDSSKQDKYDKNDSPDDRGRGYRDSSPDEPAPRTRPKSSAINFLSAKRQVMTQKTYGKTSKRARDLLEMIELDTVTFDIMDLPPVKEYELYIRSYGRSDTRQAYVQTNDDAIDRDIQTEEIDMRNKWTQHPPEDFAGSGRGDGEKDFEDEEQSQQNKQQDLGRLSKFIQQAGQVVSILLDEERSQETTELRSNKSSISMSEGYAELSKLGILQGRHVEFAYFAPTQPNMLLTIYSQPEQGNPSNPTDGKGMICVWNTNEPSYPQRILACESQPRCCCFGPYKTSIAFAGMVDGSICAWDLREPSSLHRSVEFDKTEHLLRYPTYNTAGISDSDNHISPVTTINPVTTYVDENSQQESDSKEDEKKNTSDSGSGMSFQLVSSEDQGRINFWVVAELTTTDPAGSEIDLGLSPGGKVKVVISSTIKLESLVREARSLGPIRSFEMQISPTDPNHFYIGTDGGYVLHGLRFGNRAFPRTFSALSDSPVDVKSIDFSPFGHPCFLASTAEGCVHLFGTKSDIYVLDEKPLLTWPSKIWGTRNLRCVRWSRSRPCVFYVLDDQSQLYTFDILEGDAMPAKMETLSKENVIHIAFTPHINVTGRHPQMLVSQEDGTIQIHTISKEYREQQTLEDDFLPSYLDKF